MLGDVANMVDRGNAADDFVSLAYRVTTSFLSIASH